jgi:cell division protein FtsW (lipid II flippase)
MELSRLSELADVSVARGSAFGLFAIFCLMIGLAGYPLIALKTGAVCMMLGAAVLMLKAELSRRRPYKRTELWVLLSPTERPPAAVAQQIIAGTLRAAFQRYAVYYAYAGFFCFSAAAVTQFIGVLFDY